MILCSLACEHSLGQRMAWVRDPLLEKGGMRQILWILWLESLKTKRWNVLGVCWRFHASLFDSPIIWTKLHGRKFSLMPLPQTCHASIRTPSFVNFRFLVEQQNNMRVYELIWHWARRSSANVCTDACCRDTNESAMGATSPRRLGPWSRLQGLLLSVRDHRYFKSKKSPKKPPKRRHLPMPSRSSRSSTSSRADDSDEALEKGMEMEMEDKNAATDMPELPMLQSNVPVPRRMRQPRRRGEQAEPMLKLLDCKCGCEDGATMISNLQWRQWRSDVVRVVFHCFSAPFQSPNRRRRWGNAST